VEVTDLVHWINSLIKHNNIKAFYNSSLWQHVRDEVLDEQHHECERCKAKGIYTEAVTVHHIKYLRKHPELALTKSNLESICGECHFEEHHKNKSKPQLNIERW
jgi:5-methylcytosine-specific restriction endonuclease McrA